LHVLFICSAGGVEEVKITVAGQAATVLSNVKSGRMAIQGVAEESRKLKKRYTFSFFIHQSNDEFRIFQ
jgi:hypothetical protein